LNKRKPPSTFVTAVIIILVAILLFDIQGAMIKHMGSRYPVEQIAFFRNFFGILPNLVVLYFSTQWRSSGATWKLSRWKLGFGRGVLLICAQMSFYTAVVHIELATATTLAFAGPFFITILSIPLLGHKVGRWRIFAVLLGFVGVVLVMQPGGDAFTRIAILPIAAAFFYAISSLSTRFFTKDVPIALIGIYASVGALVAALGIVLFTGNWITLNSLHDWLWFIGMGMVGGCAVLCLITAYRMADPSSLSPFEYFGIPFSFFLGWMFFNETPFDSLFPGVLFIVAGALLVIWRERQAAKS
jgi:drug/metabolite transporter (DMT)-like permease